MRTISYSRHRFPPDVIRCAVWLYLRFTLSYRDVEDLLAERGLEISNETIRRWVLKFGPVVARNLRRTRPVAHDRWHLDEMVVSIAGRYMYMWRAVDSEGEVLDVLVQPRRDGAAALKLLRKLLKRQGFAPTVIVTDRLRSYGAARTKGDFLKWYWMALIAGISMPWILHAKLIITGFKEEGLPALLGVWSGICCFTIPIMFVIMYVIHLVTE